MTTTPTPKQALLAHLGEYHGQPNRNRGYYRWTGRMTLKELQRAHGRQHHHFDGPLCSHRHQGADEQDGFLGATAGPNTTDRRPRGWLTGLDVVTRTPVMSPR